MLIERGGGGDPRDSIHTHARAHVFAVTIVSAVLITVLLVSEFNYYLTVDTQTSLFVDVTREERMRINFNITFPRLPCMGGCTGSDPVTGAVVVVVVVTDRAHTHACACLCVCACVVISVDVLDVSGEHQSDIDQNVFKSRISMDGRTLAPTATGTCCCSAQCAARQWIYYFTNRGRDALPTLQKKIVLGEKGAAESGAIVQTLPPNYCGPCYGGVEPDSKCCNSCEDVRRPSFRCVFYLNVCDGHDQVREAYRKKGFESPEPG